MCSGNRFEVASFRWRGSRDDRVAARLLHLCNEVSAPERSAPDFSSFLIGKDYFNGFELRNGCFLIVFWEKNVPFLRSCQLPAAPLLER